MDLFLIRISRWVLGRICSQQKDCILDKMWLNKAKSIHAHIQNAFSLQKTTNTIAKSIKRCMQMNLCNCSQSYINRYRIQTGLNSLKNWNNMQTEMTKVKLISRNLLVYIINTVQNWPQTNNNLWFNLSQDKQEQVVGLDLTSPEFTIKSIISSWTRFIIK
jgi:hypothetical protein